MQALLSFRFPNYPRDVVVQLFVPLPEQRPHTVANFIFALTGQVPPADMLAALRLNVAGALPVTFQDAAAARTAGLVPFADAAVVRVEKGSLVEMGGSTTKTIFGGFSPDESVTLPPGPAHGSLASTMMRRPAGAILCGNMGMPRTQGSRYYVLLKAAADPARPAEQREELESYAPLGMISSGLDDLIAAAEATQVHPRTLAPTKKVEFVGCHLEFDFRGLARKLRETTGLGALARESTRATSSADTVESRERTRIAGRTRGREEDGDTADASPAVDSADTSDGAFFHFNVHYPERSARSAGLGANAKRRRAEAMTVDEDGQPTLRTTAVHPTNGSAVNGVEGDAPFDVFSAQDAAFWNDIDLIKDQQTLRQQRRAHRAGKARFAPSASSVVTKKKIVSGLPHTAKTSSVGSSVLGKAGKRKTKRAVGKRY